MKKSVVAAVGLILLIALEISKVYFIMPFPGSQYGNTIDFAYFINNNSWWIRIIFLLLTIFPLWHFISKGKLWQKIISIIAAALYTFIAYEVNFKLLADKMFFQPKEKLFLNAQADTASKTRLIIGAAINGYAKAYPVEIIGYHHQVKDTIGGEPVIITYCTVCRTGRIYSPFVNGKYEQFRLVGMDHFNAMFEDASTKSWWRQENGVAIKGKLTGIALKEIPSSQMALEDWVALHPNTVILQPDKNFKAKYDSLKGYDEGYIKGNLEHTDTASWQRKSWVVGVYENNKYKAYDWNMLTNKKMIQDSIENSYLLLTISTNKKTAFVLNRNFNGRLLHFKYNIADNYLTDTETSSTWLPSGICIAGKLKGGQLRLLQSYQEFWHSWKTFHPNTLIYP